MYKGKQGSFSKKTQEHSFMIFKQRFLRTQKTLTTMKKSDSIDAFCFLKSSWGRPLARTRREGTESVPNSGNQ
jgi:hypothetical protein